MTSPGSGRRAGTAGLFVALGLAHLAFALWLNPPGYLTYDSGTYHLMAKTFASTGNFIIQNGHEEFPVPELAVAQTRVVAGHLVAQYPEFLSVLVYPLYVAFGYKGLLLLNALSFLGINALILKLAAVLFESRRIGILGMAIYSLATFAWEYSHSSYPHLSSSLFVLASYTLVAVAFKRRAASGGNGSSTAVLLAAGAGLLAGLAIGLRLDAAFAVPGLFLPLLFAESILIAELAALLIGFVPGLLFLAIVNSIKFDTFSPFSYGASGSLGYIGKVGFYLPISYLIGAVAALLLLWSRLPRARKPWVWKILAVGSLTIVLAFPTAVWHQVSKLADGTYQIAVDMRIRDLEIKEPGLARTPSGAMVYMGGVKKSLLQSCPYLAILPFVLFDAVRSRRRVRALAFLAIVPASYVLYFSYLKWHGSIALNMRYLNPILPFTSLMCAYAWQRLAKEISPRLAGIYGFTALVGLSILFVVSQPTLPQQEMLFLTAPLLLALGLVALEALRRLGWLPSLGKASVCYFLLTAAAWSGAMAFGRDYPASAALRASNLSQADVLGPYIQDHSLIVSDFVDSCWKLIDEVDDLLIATAAGGSAPSINGLIRFHLNQGRKVYLAYSPHTLRQHLAGGLADLFEVKELDSWQFDRRPPLLLFELGLKPQSP